jgi:hypothetical protein
MPLFKLLFASASYAFPLASNGNIFRTTKHNVDVEEDETIWLYLVTAAILVIMGGAFAGLTIAYGNLRLS